LITVPFLHNIGLVTHSKVVAESVVGNHDFCNFNDDDDDLNIVQNSVLHN